MVGRGGGSRPATPGVDEAFSGRLDVQVRQCPQDYPAYKLNHSVPLIHETTSLMPR